jgi:hypothetical protein
VRLVAAARKEASESLASCANSPVGSLPPCSTTGWRWRSTRSRTPLTVSFDLARRLQAAIELAAYFVASVALANVGK